MLTNTVIPAKAGIQWPKSLITVLILSSYPLWTSAFAGVTSWFANCQQALGPSRMVRTIYQQLSPAEVHGQLDRVVEQLREPFPQVAELLADAAPDILAFTAFPVAHWQKLWSNNPQERLNREIRRRTDVVDFSPTGCRRGVCWARCWPSSMTNGPKLAATSPSPMPSATRHCRSPICWKQRPDQHQQGRRACTPIDGTLPNFGTSNSSHSPNHSDTNPQYYDPSCPGAGRVFFCLLNTTRYPDSSTKWNPV